MDFALDARTQELQEQLLDFMTTKIEPSEQVFHDRSLVYGVDSLPVLLR